MDPHHHHSIHHQQTDPTTGQAVESIMPLAVSATFHCLLGCGLGEVLGMVLSVWLGLSMVSTTVFSIVLGFIAGLMLGIVPLLRRNFTVGGALRTVIVAEGLSIAVMEAFEFLTQWMIPGVMTAGLSDRIFWIGMVASLVVGFIAAFPVNYVMIKRGVRHVH